MKTYIAEKRCAGKTNFAPGQEVKLKPADAKKFVECGALREKESETEKKPAQETEEKK